MFTSLSATVNLTAAPCCAATSSTDSTDRDGTVEVAAQTDNAVVLLWLPFEALIVLPTRQPCGRGQVAGKSLLPVGTRRNDSRLALSARNPWSVAKYG